MKMLQSMKVAALAAALAGLGLTQAVKASNITATTTAVSGGWIAGQPIAYETGGTPTGGSGGTSQDNDSWGNTGSGAGNGINTFGSLGQAFEASSSGILSSAQIVLAGGPELFNVELYNLGPAPANWPSATTTTPVPQFNSVTANLLASGDQFQFYGTSNNTLDTLTFSGADSNVSLTAGNVYILALDPTNSSASGVWWQRGGVPVTAYNTGEGVNIDGVDGYQNFEGKTGSSGIRDMDTAITLVPEPTSIGLLGLASVSLLARRRKIA
jgi:hypothetical protein